MHGLRPILRARRQDHGLSGLRGAAISSPRKSRQSCSAISTSFLTNRRLRLPEPGVRQRREAHSKLAQESPQPCEDTPEVVADGGEDRVGGVSGPTFEISAAERASGLGVAFHRLVALPSLTLSFLASQ